MVLVLKVRKRERARLILLERLSGVAFAGCAVCVSVTAP